MPIEGGPVVIILPLSPPPHSSLTSPPIAPILHPPACILLTRPTTRPPAPRQVYRAGGDAGGAVLLVGRR